MESKRKDHILAMWKKRQDLVADCGNERELGVKDGKETDVVRSYNVCANNLLFLVFSLLWPINFTSGPRVTQRRAISFSLSLSMNQSKGGVLPISEMCLRVTFLVLSTHSLF